MHSPKNQIEPYSSGVRDSAFRRVLGSSNHQWLEILADSEGDYFPARFWRPPKYKNLIFRLSWSVKNPAEHEIWPSQTWARTPHVRLENRNVSVKTAVFQQKSRFFQSLAFPYPYPSMARVYLPTFRWCSWNVSYHVFFLYPSVLMDPMGPQEGSKQPLGHPNGAQFGKDLHRC